MALNPFRSFGSRAAALTTAAVIVAYAAPAAAQTASPTLVNAPARSAVPVGDCGAFVSYVLAEAKTFKDELSGKFLTSVVRFSRAGCAATDKDGEIQIITMTDQDGASLRTALRRMGKFDIIGVSGVKGCHRPPNGICPATVGSNPTTRPGVGG